MTSFADFDFQEIIAILKKAIEDGKKDPSYWDRMADRIRGELPKES